jgi:hypothetical protein
MAVSVIACAPRCAGAAAAGLLDHLDAGEPAGGVLLLYSHSPSIRAYVRRVFFPRGDGPMCAGMDGKIVSPDPKDRRFRLRATASETALGATTGTIDFP